MYALPFIPKCAHTFWGLLKLYLCILCLNTWSKKKGSWIRVINTRMVDYNRKAELRGWSWNWTNQKFTHIEELWVEQCVSHKAGRVQQDCNQRAGKSSKLGIKQIQGRQILTAPRHQANIGQKPRRQAKNRRHSCHRAKESRWLKPWTGRVKPLVP